MPETVMMIFLGACVLLICYFDFRWMIIPNWLNFALAAGGLLYQYNLGVEGLPFAVLFGVSVLCFFALVRLVHSRMRGFTGLGLGDVKLFGAAAVWVSPLLFPVFLLLASASALIFLATTNFTKLTSRTRLAFGPFIGVSLLITVFVEQQFSL